MLSRKLQGRENTYDWIMKQDLTICHLPKTRTLRIMTQTSRKGKNGKKYTM